MNRHHARRLSGAGALVFALALVGAPALRAQDNPCAPSPMHVTEVDLGAQMTMMTKELSLTEDQQAAIEPILVQAAEEGEEIRAMYDDQDNDEASEKLQALHKKTMGQIEAVLDDEQKKKFEQLVKMDEEEVKKQAEAAEEDMD